MVSETIVGYFVLVYIVSLTINLAGSIVVSTENDVDLEQRRGCITVFPILNTLLAIKYLWLMLKCIFKYL